MRPPFGPLPSVKLKVEKTLKVWAEAAVTSNVSASMLRASFTGNLLFGLQKTALIVHASLFFSARLEPCFSTALPDFAGGASGGRTVPGKMHRSLRQAQGRLFAALRITRVAQASHFSPRRRDVRHSAGPHVCCGGGR